MLMGIYCCKNTLGDIIYIGSSGLELSKLEWNHRNYFKFANSYESDFRKALRSDGDEWVFEWLMSPLSIPRDMSEVFEQKYIQQYFPVFNKDLRPYDTSTRRGRNDGKLKALVSYYG